MIVFWKFVVIATMVVFFPAAIIVAIKGFRDVITMFADLKASDSRDTHSTED